MDPFWIILSPIGNLEANSEGYPSKKIEFFFHPSNMI
jgi:hypothetical protein